MRFYYTYVLGCGDGTLYVGATQELERRVDEHLRGTVSATARCLPVELVYYEACLSREGALKREKQLKSGFGRAYLKRRLEGGD